MVAEYAEKESLAYGTTRAQFDAWIRMLEKVLDETLQAEIDVIVQTTMIPKFRHWERVKVAKNGLRAIIEWDEQNNMILHAVFLRDSHTYETAVKALWKQHRSRVQE